MMGAWTLPNGLSGRIHAAPFRRAVTTYNETSEPLVRKKGELSMLLSTHAGDGEE